MTEGTLVGQEAREHIVALPNLLDRFGRRTEAWEEQLWAHTEWMAIPTQVIEHTKPLERRMLQLERKIVWLENELLLQNYNVEKNRVELVNNITNHRYQLASHIHHLKLLKNLKNSRISYSLNSRRWGKKWQRSRELRMVYVSCWKNFSLYGEPEIWIWWWWSGRRRGNWRKSTNLSWNPTGSLDTTHSGDQSLDLS